MGEWELSAEEESAVRALRRLARRWPQSLTLFSASGSLMVVPTVDRGQLREDRAISIEGISNDGGDPEWTQ